MPDSVGAAGACSGMQLTSMSGYSKRKRPFALVNVLRDCWADPAIADPQTTSMMSVFMWRTFRSRERAAANSGFDRLLRNDRQPRLQPDVEPSPHVDHILKTGSLQQAARDHAAIASLAVNGNGNVAIDFWRRDFEVIERPPGCALDVPGFPLRLAANIEHL